MMPSPKNGQLVQIKVIDQHGTPVNSAKVTGHSKCNNSSSNDTTFSGITDITGYTAPMNTGCISGGLVTATASIDNYTSNSINFKVLPCLAGLYCSIQNETIPLHATVLDTYCSSNIPCLTGYTCLNGTCVALDQTKSQTSNITNKTKSYTFDKILSYIQSHWLLIVVFIFVIAIIYITTH